MPEKRFYAEPDRSQSPEPHSEETRQDTDLGRAVKKTLFIVVLLGLLGFEYRKAVWPPYNQLSPPGKLCFNPVDPKPVRAVAQIKVAIKLYYPQYFAS